MVKLLPELLIGTAVTLAWSTLVYRLPGLWGRLADARLRYLGVLIAVIAGGLTMEFAVVATTVDRLADVPNFSVLLGDLLMVAGGWAACGLMAHLRHPEPDARRVGRRFGVAAAAAATLLVALFALSPGLPEDTDYWAHYGRAPVGFLVEYRPVGPAFVTVCATYLTAQCWTFARSSLRWSTRLGFALLMGAGLLAEVYVANDALQMLPVRLGLDRLGLRPSILEPLIASLALVGFAALSLGPRVHLGSAVAWLAEYRSLRRLYPLWRELCEAAPGVAMVPPGGRLSDVLDPRDVHFRLYRRVVEIRDGLLLLEPQQARALTAAEGPADLRSEALVLERLARRARAGQPRGRGQPAGCAEAGERRDDGQDGAVDDAVAARDGRRRVGGGHVRPGRDGLPGPVAGPGPDQLEVEGGHEDGGEQGVAGGEEDAPGQDGEAGQALQVQPVREPR
jgi:hypothetical protein